MTDEVHDRIRDYWDRDSHTYDETRSHAISDPLDALRNITRLTLSNVLVDCELEPP